MKIVDAQHHELGPVLDWDQESVEIKRRLMSELLLGWMDAVGVDAALINAIDDDWAADATAGSPNRLAAAVTAKPDDPEIESKVERIAASTDKVAVRVQCYDSRQDPSGDLARERLEGGWFDRLFNACDKHNVPAFCSAYGYVEIIGDVARRYPNVLFVADHMGIQQPPVWPALPDPWDVIPGLINVAKAENTFVKITGAPSLSQEAYPYRDIWKPLHQVIGAFGPERTMWASDIGRFVGRIGWGNTMFPQGLQDYQGKHTYAEGLHFLRDSDELSTSEKEWILGKTVTKFVNWPA